MSVRGPVPVTLPRGLWRDGVRLRRAGIRPVTGRDEEELADSAGSPAAVRVSLLLGRCLETLEDEPVEGPTTARALSVGDRDALLLHLRRISIGDAMDCLIACPRPDCGETLDFRLRVADLLLPPSEPADPSSETVLEVEDEAWTVRLRPPTGADQEAAAGWLETEGVERAVARLVERCVEVVSRPEGRSVADPPPALMERLSEAIARAEPQADLVLHLECPECGETFSTRFDPAGYLLDELVSDRDRLVRHVHLLALHYHWGESEIHALTPRKRRRYLELLAEEPARGAA